MNLSVLPQIIIDTRGKMDNHLNLGPHDRIKLEIYYPTRLFILENI